MTPVPARPPSDLPVSRPPRMSTPVRDWVRQELAETVRKLANPNTSERRRPFLERRRRELARLLEVAK
jgi:hypothetical protein